MQEIYLETNRPKRRWAFFLFGAIILILLVGAGAAAYAWHQVYSPVDANNFQESIFTVEKGTGVKKIAARLREENLIRSRFWFETYVWYKKEGANLKAGQYALSPSLSAPQVLEIITGGKIIPNEVQITFPEGFTVAQIQDRLLEKGIESAKDFDREKIDGFQVQYKFLSQISPEFGLEGFLFPDTYRFKKDVKKEEITKKLLENFDRKLTPDMRAEINSQKKTIYDVVILASIVQQEALNDEEMPVLAGIFLNRLGKNMLLQSDATVNFATGKKSRQASASDLAFDSPYNTYKYAGLPPTPICNPGLEAIKAVIYPTKTDYYYFLHPLNSGAVYSQTLDEHNRNKAKYLK